MTNDVELDVDGTDSKRLRLFPHWRTCIGGGRTAEALRARFQQHLEMVQRDMPFSYLRVHGVFHEDMMVYRESAGRAVLNWQYVDMVYDHWLSVGIRPFVELGFMPYDLASGAETVFWWRGNITPPRDWDRWERLVRRFVEHVIERYGLEEVRRWYFEVWNEPNLEVFWKGADFAAYVALYERTARAIKDVDPSLRVGGPATSGAGEAAGRSPWGQRFLAECRRRSIPIDFFSTHPYPTLHTADLAGEGDMTWDGPDRLAVDLRGVNDLLAATGYSGLERHFTEWSSSPSPRDPAHDTAFMAPFIVRNNWAARGLADGLAFWALSDIFEENRLGDGPFHGGFGLVNAQSLKKAAYHGYWFLSRLGPRELASGERFAATVRDDGTLAILLWNYQHYRGGSSRSLLEYHRPPDEPDTGEVYGLFEPGTTEHFRLRVSGLDGTVRVTTTRLDREHGSVYDAWLAIGAPSHIRPADLEVLRARMEPEQRSECLTASGGRLEYSAAVEPHGVTLLEFSAGARPPAPVP
ncbi:MAG: beta-xylosidase [Acidimicrobiales bacterium]